MLTIGRVCMKLAGRDAGQTCVVVDTIDKNFVMVDGNTRRKKVNIVHLEPTDKTLDLGKGASHEAVIEAFKKAKLLKVKKAVKRPAKAAKPKTK